LDGPELNIGNWILATLPVAFLIVTILWRKWSAPRAGGMAWLLAFALAATVFGATSDHIAIASAKGLSLALFVLSIVWTSVYMFNIIDRLDGIQVIGRTMAKLTDDRLAQALLIAWGFASFIQGVTGFGVPVAVAAPLLIMLASPIHQAGTLVGIDPVHLGVILVITALIGTVSPPVSLLLCLNCGIAKIPLHETFGVIWSYLAVMLGVVAVCILIPELVTWLPGLELFQ